MKEYRYVYQPRKKYVCPNCGQKTLKRFIDTTTGELIEGDYGVCERVINCCYEKRPEKEMVETIHIERPPTIPFYFKDEAMYSTLEKHNSNVLFNFLVRKFGNMRVDLTFHNYKIGTDDFGSTIFWQIDEDGHIRAGKRIQYFSDGHRNKARGASWLHWSNGFDESKHTLNQCLFGQHLLNDRYSDIFIVESEKTALICDICKRKDFALFLATGGMQNIGLVAKLKIAPHQKIWYLPDNDGNKIWQGKIEKFGLPGKIKITPALQEMKIGSDVGDLLINNNLIK